jgi:outer membrane protein assembly factor BamD
MRVILLLTLLASLMGCAATSTRGPAEDPEAVEVRARLSLGGCEPQLADQILRLEDPGLEHEAAFQCLQQGQLATVERLLSGYQERHAQAPNADYSMYLLALTDFARFELAQGDADEQLRAGRHAHDGLVVFVRLYPESVYRTEVAPRLKTLHEGMARAEYRLALGDIEKGRRETGAARLRYIAREYPRSAAATDAKRWLEQRLDR